MKGYSTFTKAPGLEPHYQMQFSVMHRTLVGGRGLVWLVDLTPSSVEVQLAYITAPTDWDVFI